MADIKTRDVTRGTIKTLDRAASSMHHLKEETIRSKAAEAGNRYDNGSAGSYAQTEVEHIAGDGAAYAARAGVDMMLRSREKTAYGAEHLSEAGDLGVQSRFYLSNAANPATEYGEEISRALREQGIKAIRDRRNKAKLADKEILANAEEDRVTDRIRGAAVSVRRPAGIRSERAREKNDAGGYRSGRIVRSRHKYSHRDDLVQRRRRELAIKRIREKNSSGGLVKQIPAPGGGQNAGKAADRVRRLLNDIARSAKSAVTAITAGGSAAVLIVVIMIICGGLFAMLGDEDGNDFAFDFYGIGYGDTAIVKVAQAELGNVGGDKFWKWYGFKSHVHWCACFVSWCANQCGYIETGIIPKFAVVGDGASWFKARHRWAGRGYKPKPGDIIFFDFEQDGLLDHVGIVETCDGKTVTTIEGNSGNACKRQYYRVGSSQIAGYGLVLIPGGGNKSQMIARKATQLAYPDSPKESRYHGGKPTPAYKAALERAYPHRGNWGKPSRDGASCDVFVGVCIVDSGVDKDFPRGYRDQAIRLDKRKDLYDCVISTTSRDIKVSELKDGDIIRYDKSNGGVHIMIYVGGKIKQAGHDNFYPKTNSPGSKLKIKGKKLIRVYRVKG